MPISHRGEKTQLYQRRTLVSAVESSNFRPVFCPHLCESRSLLFFSLNSPPKTLNTSSTDARAKMKTAAASSICKTWSVLESHQELLECSISPFDLRVYEISPRDPNLIMSFHKKKLINDPNGQLFLFVHARILDRNSSFKFRFPVFCLCRRTDFSVVL